MSPLVEISSCNFWCEVYGCIISVSSSRLSVAFTCCQHAHALELLADKLVEGARALDVGSGSGYLTACMAVMVSSIPVIYMKMPLYLAFRLFLYFSPHFSSIMLASSLNLWSSVEIRPIGAARHMHDTYDFCNFLRQLFFSSEDPCTGQTILPVVMRDGSNDMVWCKKVPL